MRFKRAIQRYGEMPAIDTPFARASQLWDQRIGSARLQARNWRLVALGNLGLSAALATGMLWQSLQSRVVPYVVEVDQLGEARAVNEAEQDFSPSDAQVAWHLSRFIEHVRSVSLDPVLMRRDWLSAYDFATKRGAQFLGDYARRADPFTHIGDRTVSVQITSVVRASESSFQLKWIETQFEHGARTAETRWTGIVTVIQHMPDSAEVLRKNPLGIYVDAVDWSQELEPPGIARPPMASITVQPPTIVTPIDPDALISLPSSKEYRQ